MGNPTASIDRNGRLISCAYDDLGRLISEKWYNTSSAPATLGEIDPWIAAQVQNAPVYEASYSRTLLGQVDTAHDSQSEYDFDYDPFGMVDDISFQYDAVSGKTFDLDYSYKPSGALQTVAVSMDGVIDHTNAYTFDVLGRLQEVQQTGGATVQTKRVTVDYGYDAGAGVAVRTTRRYEPGVAGADANHVVVGRSETYADGRHKRTEYTLYATGESNPGTTISRYSTSYTGDGLLYNRQEY